MNRKFPKNKEADEGEREEKSEGANTGQILRSTKALSDTQHSNRVGQYMAASHMWIPSL